MNSIQSPYLSPSLDEMRHFPSQLDFSSRAHSFTSDIDYWTEDLGKNLFGLDFKFKRNRSFYVDLKGWMLGELFFSDLHFQDQLVTAAEKSVNSDLFFLKFVRSGSMIIEQHNKTITAEQGSIILAKQQKNFREYFPEHCNLTFLSIPSHLINRLGIYPEEDTPTTLYNREAPETQMLWNMMLMAASLSESMDSNQRRTLSLQILGWLKLTHDGLQRLLPHSESRTRTTRQTLARIKHYIQQNLHQPDLDTNQIAAATRLSSGYINRLFNTENTSIMRYVLEARLATAKNLLLNTNSSNTSIDEIAWSCGFSSLSHFSRSFKKHVGISPRDFRKKERQEK